MECLTRFYDTYFVTYSNDVSLSWSAWMSSHYEIPTILAVIYVIVIFSVREIMKNREPFALKGALIVWNALLAVFSMVGFYVLLWEILRVLAAYGFIHDLCTADAEITNPWTLFFCLSKIPELLDTVFIVLRKRPLIFLHYYHHIVTMFYCWDSYAVRVNSGGWFAFMNLFVHSIMYSYYAATAYGVRFSRPLRQSITALQILQMIAGTVLTVLSIQHCDDPVDYNDRVLLNLKLGLVMYASYWLLFTKYFADAYLFTKPAPHTKKD